MSEKETTMAKYVLVYTGGGGMAPSPEEQDKIMEAWMSWFGSLGEAVVDVGNPFAGPSCTVTASTMTEGGAAELGGYSIITAEDIADAAAKAKGCPVLLAGGGVEIYEATPIG